MFRDDIAKTITASEAKQLFADWKSAPAIVLAVSGGPDSVALMWLAARWRAALKEKEAACAAFGEITRKYPKASNGVKQGVDREQKRVGC